MFFHFLYDILIQSTQNKNTKVSSNEKFVDKKRKKVFVDLSTKNIRQKRQKIASKIPFCQ